MTSKNKGFGVNSEDIQKKKLIIDNEFSSQSKKAINLAREGKLFDAERIYKFLIAKGKYDHLTFHRLSAIYEKLGRKREAFDYLKKAIKLKKNYGEAYVDIGRFLFNAGEINNSIKYLELSLKYNPGLVGAYINLGNILAKIGNHKEALKHYIKAAEIENLPIIFNNIGNILAREKKYIDAEINYKKALKIDVNYIAPKIGLIEIYLETFNTEAILSLRSFIDKVGLLDGEDIFHLLTFFYLDASPKKQYVRALNFYKKKHGNPKNNLKAKNNKKIRIGYISADFNDHPVSKIIETILSNHDKSNYEIFGYSLDSNEDEVTNILKKHFNSFICIQKMSISDAVNKIRSDNLDIAVDLMGYTSKNMSKIFNERIAPKQINYLGFPGTTGAKNIDFLIADEFVIPKKDYKYYTEKIIQMPNCFINSIKYEYSKSKKDSSIQSLPEGSCLLAAFHQTSKLSVEVVDIWAKILHKSENTFLWLKNPNNIAKQNLISFFKAKNIDEDRIIFAKNVDSYVEHLSRYSSADIFLDTFFYNGHTTLVECIWSELPFITLPGKSFASRVGGSILHCLDLDELICESVDEYIEKVIFYSLSYEKLNKLKNKIKKQKKISKFFDQKTFTENLEDVYLKILSINK